MDYTDFSGILKRRGFGYTAGMEEKPGNQERAPYNLRTDFEATMQAMAEVERGGWLRSNIRVAENWEDASEGDRSASLEGARRWLATVDPSEDRWHVVYGDGGVNRWYVHADGRVRFSKFHAIPEGLRRAEALGFWIE